MVDLPIGNDTLVGAESTLLQLIGATLFVSASLADVARETSSSLCAFFIMATMLATITGNIKSVTNRAEGFMIFFLLFN
jgi:hypothetical protein